MRIAQNGSRYAVVYAYEKGNYENGMPITLWDADYDSDMWVNLPWAYTSVRSRPVWFGYALRDMSSNHGSNCHNDSAQVTVKKLFMDGFLRSVAHGNYYMGIYFWDEIPYHPDKHSREETLNNKLILDGCNFM
jgi:hypothetical protein